jgi:hypothetical protein
MFEDDVQKSNNIPTNLPVEEPVDMFAGIDKDENITGDLSELPKSKIAPPDALSAGLLKKKEPIVETMPESLQREVVGDAVAMNKMRGPVLGKILVIIFGLLLLGGLTYSGWYVYVKYIKNSVEKPPVAVKQNTEENTVSAVQSSTAIVAPVVTVSSSITTTDVTAKMKNDTILFGETVDSDKDGLDDDSEKNIYKTNPNNSDSDNDSLNDYDEIVIWHTNPLKDDTDGDTYKDGEEIKYGYNPLGLGKLFNVPQSATSTTGSKK